MAKLTLMIGLPGSGKSTYVSQQYDFRRIFLHNVTVLSSDRVRRELYHNENDTEHNEEVFSYIKETAVNSLRTGIDVVIDATNVTRKGRMNLIESIASKIGYFYEDHSVEYIVIATSYYKCLENNMKRQRQVPAHVIERMYKNFEFPTRAEIVNYYSGAIKIVFPFKTNYEIEKPYELLYNFNHENPHHRYSVGKHMFHAGLVMRHLTNNRVMIKAAEIHDMGKPFCKFYDKNNSEVAHFYNHENVGAYEAMFYGKGAKFTTDEIIELCSLVNYHMRIHNCETAAARDRLLTIVGTDLFYKLQMLMIADKEAH